MLVEEEPYSSKGKLKMVEAKPFLDWMRLQDPNTLVLNSVNYCNFLKFMRKMNTKPPTYISYKTVDAWAIRFERPDIVHILYGEES